MLCPKWMKKSHLSTVSIASEDESTMKPGQMMSHGNAKEKEVCRAVAFVELIKKPGAPTGLGISGGADKGTPPIVSNIIPGGVAYRSDSLQVGDWLIAINGIKVTTLKQEEILSLLRNATDMICLTIEYDLNDHCFEKHPSTYSNSVDLSMMKEGGCLGFTMRGGAYGPDPTKSRPLTVTAIRPGGPADREGRISIGDRIIGINGVDVSTATLSTAVNLLKKADSNCVCLTIEYDVRILESVKNASGPLLLEIVKQQGIDIGITLHHSDAGPKRSIIVERVTPASIADRCGALHVGDEILTINKMTLEYTTLPEVYQLMRNSSNGQIHLEIMPYSQLKDRRPSAYANLADHLYLANRGLKTSPVNGRKKQIVSVAVNKNGSDQKSKSKGKMKPKSKPIQTSSPNDEYAKIVKIGDRNNSQLKSNVAVVKSRRPSNGSVSASVSGVPCGQVCHSEVMEVVLNCWARGGYGLILHRNQNFSEPIRCPLFVSYIERGSPADKSGVLQVGDRILAINEWCTANGTPEEANYIIRHATGPLTLTVEFDVIETVLPSSGIFTVKLAKRGQYLGIVVHGSTSGHKGEPVIVRDIRTGSVAHRCGSIQPEDLLLSIDNIPLDTCTIEEAVRLLQKSSDIVKLRVKKNLSSLDEFEPSSNTVIYSVELNRKGGHLGITIAGNDDQVDPIIISQMAPGGIAEKTGAIHIGDRILAINGQSLQGKRVSEAMQMLQQTGDTLSLKIARFALDHSRYPHSQLAHIGLDRPHINFQDHFPDRDTTDKLGTPVQSIDSAVESLEDSPLTESQHPSTSSNRNSQNSNSKSSSISGAGPTDTAQFVEDLSLQLHKTLSTLKGGSVASTSQGSRSEASSAASNAPTEDDHYVQLGGESCPCQSHSHVSQSQEEWIRVLEALETIGENEMLRKLEESILSGNVPACGSSDHTRPSTPKPPPKPPLNPPFPLTNTILKHPFTGSRHLPTSSDGQQRIGNYSGVSSSSNTSKDIFSSSMIGTNLPTSSSYQSSSTSGSQRPLSVSTILSSYEHIPYITSPILANTSSFTETSSARNGPSVSFLTNQIQSQRTERSSSPSSIQLSGTATPSYDGGLKEMPNINPPTTSNGAPPIPLEIHRITLYKDLMYNDFGFSVSDGVQEKGVYINKIRAGGPADRSGNVRPYDRILQVNETSLQDLDCLLAVPLLAAAGDKIDLLLCRDPTVLARQPDSIEEEDEDERLTPEQTQV